MGHKLTRTARMLVRAIPPWLDAVTSALVVDLIQTLTGQRPDLLAIILYGSMARQDERPVDDSQPSDVDLLAVFDTDDEHIAIHQGNELFHILGQAYNRHLDILRDVKFMFASRILSEWDETFIANVAQDWILLWARGELPKPLAALTDHQPSTSPDEAMSKQAKWATSEPSSPTLQ